MSQPYTTHTARTAHHRTPLNARTTQHRTPLNARTHTHTHLHTPTHTYTHIHTRSTRTTHHTHSRTAFIERVAHASLALRLHKTEVMQPCTCVRTGTTPTWVYAAYITHPYIYHSHPYCTTISFSFII